MAVNVYAWPPVGAVSTLWTFEQPSSVSESGLTGAARVSLIRPERRRAKVVVSALSNGRNGAGYSEVLKRLLRGGAALVRLQSSPINWHLDAESAAAWQAGGFLRWITGADAPLTWNATGGTVSWFSGLFLTGVIGTSNGFPSLTLSGLPASQPVIRPGESVQVFQDPGDPDEVGVSIMAVAPAQSNADGVAVIRLISAPPYAARVAIGRETAVFRAVSVPSSEQPVGANWTLPWDFQEVLPAEVGGFVENRDWWAQT
jgi:hypothetical protein